MLAVSKVLSKAQQKSYILLKWTFASVACWWLYLLLALIHYGAYSEDGIGAPGALHASFFFEVFRYVK